MIEAYWGSDIPAFQTSQYPTNTPFATAQYPYGTIDTSHRKERNTFYWNAQQFATLGTTNLANLNWTHLRKARIRHWLGKLTDGSYNHSDTLSYEQAPSPDGTTQGQITWYDHSGISYTTPDVRGNQVQPAVVARKQPDGTIWHLWYQRNAWGTVTNLIEKNSTIF